MTTMEIHAPLYETLGLELSATAQEIKKRYFELAKEYHPDRYHTEDQDMKEIAEKMFSEIKIAYETLTHSLSPQNDEINIQQTVTSPSFSDTDYAKRFYTKGIEFYKDNDINSSLDCFMNAKRIMPDDYDYQRMIIRCLLKKPRRIYEAKDLCLNLVKAEAFNPENNYLMGEVYRSANLEDAATRYYDKALQLGFSEKKINTAILSLQQSKKNLKRKGLFNGLFRKS